MDKGIRWRIALWFTCLSAVVYVVPTMLAIYLFNLNLTADLDNELKVFSASFGHAIRIEHGSPVFRDWARTVQTEPAKTPAAIQLFDRNGILKDKYGIQAIAPLSLKSKEVHDRDGLSMRLRVTPLKLGNELIGYLQISLPTTQRDSSVRQLALVMAMVAPMVLMGLGWCSYLVSEKALEPVKKSNEMLRQFIADAGHELNTPLSIIQAAAESQEKKLTQLGVEARELATISGAADRMGGIVDDLVLLSNVENLALSEKREEFSINELILNVVRELETKFEAKKVSLLTDAIPDKRLIGDQDAMHRLFLNLLQNALAFTEAQGQVKITAAHENGLLHIHVIDTGIGIPAQSIPKVFDRFYRVDKSRSRASGGSGLGLPIAQAIAKAHGGAISVTSTANVGSDFAVTLPTP